MRQQYARRIQLIMAVMGFVSFAIVLQMIRIQTSPAAKTLVDWGEDFTTEWRTFYPDRGEIYDRSGHLLAGNKTVYEVSVNLNNVKAYESAEAIANAVASELGLDYATIYGQMISPKEGITTLVLQDFVEYEKGQNLIERKKKLDEEAKKQGTYGPWVGLEFRAHPQRSYPENDLASNIIGFVSREGRGYFGVEEKYDVLLAGNPVLMPVPTDPNKATELEDIPDGTTLILTINRDLQAAAETLLDDSLDKYGAVNGTIVIMDPRNGELLAVASHERMDLNKFWEYNDHFVSASDYNRAVSTPYEPGSVLKILTMAAALDSGVATPGTTYLDTGSILVGGAIIRNWDGGAWGVQDMTGCLQHSLNVCMATLSTAMGPTTFYSYMDKFGMGHLTGVDLAGEAAGRLKLPGDTDWYPVDLGTNSFGQGVAATPIQIMMAASAIANDGKSVTPHAVYAMVREGRQYNVPAQLAGSPISQQTADTLSEMLAVSVSSEGSMAKVEGYRLAGKTGTAQIPVNGVYDDSATNASFIGWGPVDDPRFMIYVWLERPEVSIWGSETAAPVFAEMAKKTIVLLDIPPDHIRQQLAAR